MSEKQFKLSSETVLQYQIMDNDTDLNENEVCGLLNEQQATIRKLQDLCGESDGENAKLRIKNKEQQVTINELQSIINHIKCEENCEDYDYCCETVCSLYKEIKHLKEENEQLRRLFEEMKQPITINLTEEDEKELRKLLGLIDDE